MLATIRLATTATLIAAALTGTAHADPLAESRSRQVSHADLDLSSPRGVDTLNRRISTALNTVCGTADGRDLAERARIRTCRVQAIAAAAPAVELAIAGARSGTELARNDQAPSIRLAAH